MAASDTSQDRPSSAQRLRELGPARSRGSAQLAAWIARIGRAFDAKLPSSRRSTGTGSGGSCRATCRSGSMRAR